MKRRGSKGTGGRGKKAKKDEDEEEGEEEQDNGEEEGAKSEHAPEKTAKAASQEAKEVKSSSQSLDALQTLSSNYNQIQSLDHVLETYKRNQDYVQPLGRLSKERVRIFGINSNLVKVQEARDILDNLKEVIDAGASDQDKIVELSNKFYTYVPNQDQTLPPINNSTLLEDKYTLLKSME